MLNRFLSFTKPLVAFSAWSYAGLLAFVWFLARHLPGKLVFLRVCASFISDVVWIPLGLVLWYYAAAEGLRVAAGRRMSAGARLLRAGVFVVSLFFVVVFHEAAFRFLFIPVLVTALSGFVSVSRRRNLPRLFFPCFFALAFFTAYYNRQLLPPFPVPAEDSAVTIMTYNILGNADPGSRMSAIRTIREVRPDIVCCTEYNPRTDPVIFQAELGSIYPYRVTNRDRKSWRTGELILSRFPLSLVPGENPGTSNFVMAEVNLNGTKAVVVNLHLTRMRRSRRVDSLAALAREVLGMSVSEGLNDGLKYEQALKIMKRVKELTCPVIVCGDFNDTPNGRVYDLFADGFTNAFARKGWGLGDTFGESSFLKFFGRPAWLKHLSRDIIRIDHIFLSGHFEVLSSRTVEDATGSDHKPVVAAVRLK